VIAAAGGDLLQVGTGAEGAAAAGQDGNRARRLAVEAAKGGSQRPRVGRLTALRASGRSIVMMAMQSSIA